MIYISKLLGRQVWDSFGYIIGELDDILVGATGQKMAPVAALALKKNPHEIDYISATDIATLWPGITLKVSLDKIKPYSLTGHELPLKEVQ